MAMPIHLLLSCLRSETARAVCAADLGRWVRDVVPQAGLAGRTQTRCQLIALLYYVAVSKHSDAEAAWKVSNSLVRWMAG